MHWAFGSDCGAGLDIGRLRCVTRSVAVRIDAGAVGRSLNGRRTENGLWYCGTAAEKTPEPFSTKSPLTNKRDFFRALNKLCIKSCIICARKTFAGSQVHIQFSLPEPRQYAGICNVYSHLSLPNDQ